MGRVFGVANVHFLTRTSTVRRARRICRRLELTHEDVYLRGLASCEAELRAASSATPTTTVEEDSDVDAA